MTAKPEGTVPTVRVTRIIRATPEAVFAAWLDPDSIRRWMYPGDIKDVEAELDARVGGRFRIVMHGEENDHVMTGEYVEITPPSRLAFTWESNVTTGESLVTLELHPRGEQTELVLTHERLPDATFAANYEKGWTAILDKLADSLG